MLYPRNGPRKESPIGVYRMDAKLALRRAVPNPEAHETIERAWLLHQRHQRHGRAAELQRKWNSMHRAMSELMAFDFDRYLEANKAEDPRIRTDEEVAAIKAVKGQERQYLEGRVRGLFPREMRIPANTPARSGWNHEWRSPLILLAERRAAEEREQ